MYYNSICLQVNFDFEHRANLNLSIVQGINLYYSFFITEGNGACEIAAKVFVIIMT